MGEVRPNTKPLTSSEETMDLPEFRLMSENACPNSGVIANGLDSIDLHDGVTSYGYCGFCWATSLIPPAWVTRVGDRLEVPIT